MKDKLRIAHIALTLEAGGLETVVIELCLNIDRALFDPVVICLQGYDLKYAAKLVERKIPIQLLNKSSKFDLSYFLRVARFLRNGRFDILHAHSGCLFYAALFASLAGIKNLIYTAHGLPILNGVKDHIEDNFASLVCTKVVAVSEEIRNIISARMPLARNKMTVIVNGIDTNLFKPVAESRERSIIAKSYGLPSDCFVVGSVGRLEAEKNYSMLVRAFARMTSIEGARQSHLVFIGQGSRQEELKGLVRHLALSQRVTFLGMQYKIQEILPIFDAFVLSSITEGTSISLLEAQACAVPAVVTDVGGNAFIVRSGENGFLCRVNDDVKMAEALCRLRDDPALTERMRLKSRERVLDGLTLDAMVRRYQELYLQNQRVRPRV